MSIAAPSCCMLTVIYALTFQQRRVSQARRNVWMASEENKNIIYCIILANIQDQLNWIKSMAIETGVLHVLIGTYDLLPFCNLDGQMARRGSEFHFARYHMEDENDCQAFRNAFSSLLKQIPLQVDHDTLIQRWWYFFEGSIGCIGTLKQWLVRSLYRALREESPELTRAPLEQSVLPDAKWERMRADASSGDTQFPHA